MQAAQIGKTVLPHKLQMAEIAAGDRSVIRQTGAANDLQLHLPAITKHGGNCLDPVQGAEVLAVPQLQPP